MRRALLFSAAALSAAHGGALAATQRAFVSIAGDDANAAANCSLALPCRSFAAAVDVVNPGGEVVAIDSGGYGPVILTKSVTIQAPPGVYAGISVLTGNGITVNAPGERVTLRGLTINGQGGDVGIALDGSATSLRIERCTIGNFIAQGVVAMSAASRLYVSDTVIWDIGGTGLQVGNLASFDAERLRVVHSGQDGIGATNASVVTLRDVSVLESGAWGVQLNATTGTPVDAVLERVAASNNAHGALRVTAASTGPATASVADSAFTDNGAVVPGNGTIRIEATSPSKAQGAIERTLVQRGFGDAIVASGSGATASASASTLTSNAGAALANGGGTIYTRQTNTIRGNAGQELANQTSGSITPLAGG